MQLTEQKYHATRGECADSYQWLEVTQEAGEGRGYITFELMQTRWREPAEAAAYVRWAAGQIETLAGGK